MAEDDRTHHDIHGSLANAVVGLQKAFATDELAFLAATGKPELLIRDRIAWHLQQAIGADLVVSREWKRADLAILDGSAPIAQVEAKAFYAFDVLKTPQLRIAALRADAAKMVALASSDRYLLSLVTDISGDIAPHLRANVVKYSPGIRQAIRAHAVDVRGRSHSEWSKVLATTFPEAETRHVPIDGGSVWGLHVTVDAYLTGPLAC